jgi:hypothetical protein
MRKVRKEVKFVGVVALLVLLGLMVSALQSYSIKGTVVEVNFDEVVVEDVTGRQWKVFADDLEKGDEVVLKMKDKGTTNRADDEVKDLIVK